MFKRLSKAQALREELGEETEETGPVTIETALDEESASEEEFSDDDDDDNDDDEEDEEGDDDEEDEGDVQFTVRDALESPIYLDDEAPGRAEIFRCVACPIVMLKNDKAIEVHAESKVRRRTHPEPQAAVPPFCRVCACRVRARRRPCDGARPPHACRPARGRAAS